MPAEKNTLLRIVVPVVIGLLGFGIVYAGYRNSARQAAPPQRPAVQTPAVASSEQPKPAEPQATTATNAEKPAIDTPALTVPPADASSPPMLRARVQPVPAAAPATIGGLVKDGPDRAQISFTLLGAGVEKITMADFFETTSKQSPHYDVQQRMQVPGPGGVMESLTSLAARAVLIDGQLVDLFGSDAAPLWRESAPGAFEAEIIDENELPVLRLTRRFTLRPGSFIIDVEQRAENLSGKTTRIEWVQYGPIELHEDIGGYGLDMRRVRIGHLLNQQRDPSRQIVVPDTRLQGRTAVVDRVLTHRDGEVWPRPADFPGAGELVWLAQTSRYFAFAIMPRLDPQDAAANLASPQNHPIAKPFVLADEVYALVRGQGDSASLRLLLQLTSRPLTLESVGPASAADLSFSAYAGPLGRRQLAPAADPVFGALALSDIVIYNIGGMCAWCTFQPLARGMLAFLTFLHDYVVFDWAVAIMILVVCVRSVLHPLTRKSQISMARFSKQMQSLAPKQQKIKERFKDDPKRMQEEMMRLMKEEKVNYAGALGCLPMFLQTPIWIALYAMLYFSFDLRHTPGFYGVFQMIGGWTFLGDLSGADHFIDFGRTIVTLPLFGAVKGINILPLILGVVFFVQQKYLTPPPTSAMSPEQEMQMKMMKFMTVVMFPLLMYNAPSGLAIYFITNSTLGILESRWIRAHINELDKQPPKGDDPLGRRKVKNLAPKP
ncbi:MAG: membrane protein insertase YidC [Phycisphaerae bacterium]|nr:membrane protein insertase YidC [Phycisphaerae bacterium]